MVVLLFLITAFLFGPIASLDTKESPFLKTQINDEKHATAFNKLLNSIVKTNQKRLDAINKLTKLQATDVFPSLDPLRSRRGSEETSSESEEKNIIYLVIPDTPVPNLQDVQRTEPKTAPNQPMIPPAPQPQISLNNLKTSNTSLNLSPSYLNPSPSYSNPSPSYSNPSPSYSNPSPSYSNPSPSYLNPSPVQTKSNPRSSVQSISKDGLDALRVSIERSCKSREVKKCKNACTAAVKSACALYECKRKMKKKFKKFCKRECKEEFSGSW